MQSNFFIDVVDVVRLIPKGKVTTYGSIAKYLGSSKSSRSVGWVLNKQVLETVQILRVIDKEYPTKAWQNHPAVVQWHDHEYKLAYYGLMMEQEANKRGIKSNQKEK